MADQDYWKSSSKYYCKYCSMFVTDNTISRQQHESNPAHRRNMDKFVAALARQEKEKRKEEAEAKRALREIEKAAQESYQRDLIAAGVDPVEAAVKAAMALGSTASSTSSSSSSSAAASTGSSGKKPPLAAAITQPKPPPTAVAEEDADQEGEPDTSAGVPGDWQVVEEHVIEEVNEEEDHTPNVKSKKRPLPEDDDNERHVETADDPTLAERELHAEAPDAGKFRIQERVVSLDTGAPVNTVLGGGVIAGASSTGVPVMKKRKVVSRNVRKG